MSIRLSPQQQAVLDRLDGGDVLHWNCDGWFQFGNAPYDRVAKPDMPNGRAVDALIRKGLLVLRENERNGDMIPVQRAA